MVSSTKTTSTTPASAFEPVPKTSFDSASLLDSITRPRSRLCFFVSTIFEVFEADFFSSSIGASVAGFSEGFSADFLGSVFAWVLMGGRYWFRCFGDWFG